MNVRRVFSLGVLLCALLLCVPAWAVTITTDSLPTGSVGSDYSVTLEASGGSGSYIWAASGLPDGLSLDGLSGDISGTPTTAGEYTVTVTVVDSGTRGSASRSYTLLITGAPILDTTVTALDNASVGFEYSYDLKNLISGTQPIVWSASGLPDGLTIDPTTGVISGTPTTAGTYSVTVTATNSLGTASGTYTLLVSEFRIILPDDEDEPEEGALGEFYSLQLTVSGDSAGGPYTWTIESGSLPAGLTLSGSGLISGVPTEAGSYTVTVRVVNRLGQAARRIVRIIILRLPVFISTVTELTSGTVNLVYYYDLRNLLSGTGMGSITWAATGLPAGLSINGATGEIYGTPTATGTFTVTITATNSLGSTSRTFTLRILAESDIDIVNSTLPGGFVGSSYSYGLTIRNTAVSVTWSASGLPNGLSINSATGVISGRPTVRGTFTVTITTTRSDTGETRTVTLTLMIRNNPEILTTTITGGTRGQEYRFKLEAAGDPSVLVWSLVGGRLPSGLILGSDGVISGIPTASGFFSFTVRVRNSVGYDDATLYILIFADGNSDPNIITTDLPASAVGAFYSSRVEARGTSPIYWSLVSGVLPTGLALNATTGAITGTPTEQGLFVFSVAASNAVGSSTRVFRISIEMGGDVAPDVPPNVEATVVTRLIENTGGTVTFDVRLESGIPLPVVTLYVWLLEGADPNVTGPSYIGPLSLQTQTSGRLTVNVNALKYANRAGYASILAGTYIIRFVDANLLYVGTSPAVTLRATGGGSNSSGGGGGGGCNAGLGALTLAAAAWLAWGKRG